ENGDRHDNFTGAALHEMNADGRLVDLDFAGRVIVNLQDKVRPFAQLAAHAVAQGLRSSPRGPAADAATGGEPGAAEAGETGPGIGGVFFAGDARIVEIENRMVNDPPIAGTKLGHRDELILVDVDGNHEVAKHV